MPSNVMTSHNIVAYGKRECLQGPAPYYKVEQRRVHLELRSNKLVTGTMTIQFIVQIRKQKGEPLINIYTN